MAKKKEVKSNSEEQEIRDPEETTPQTCVAGASVPSGDKEKKIYLTSWSKN